MSVQLSNKDSEVTLLLSMLSRAKVLGEVLPKLTSDMFIDSNARAIFDRIVTLTKDGKTVGSPDTMAIDPGMPKEARLLLIAESKRQKAKVDQLKVSDAVTLAETLGYYRRVRVVYQTVKSASELLKKKKFIDVSQVQRQIQEDLAGVASDDMGSMVTLGQGATLSDDDIDKAFNKSDDEILPTGFKAIDRKIRGWRKTNVVLITAYRGEGKSLLAKTLSLNHFKDKRNVFVANLEMAQWEYMIRMFAETTPITQEQMRLAHNNKKIIRAVQKSNNRIKRFGEYHGCRWTCRSVSNPLYSQKTLHQELKYQGYDVIVIDYINLLAAGAQGSGDLWNQIYDAAQYIKTMAKDLNCLVYVLAQLNEEGRAKYGRALEEAADVWLHWQLDRGDSVTVFEHGKARDYDPFDFELQFDGRNSSWKDTGATMQEDDDDDDGAATKKPARRAKTRAKLTPKQRIAEARKAKKDKEEAETKARRGKPNEPKQRTKRSRRGESKPNQRGKRRIPEASDD